MLNTSTNPGSVDVSLQAFPPPPGAPPTPSSAPLASSNGEVQFPASRPAESLSISGTGLPAEIRPDDASCVRPLAVVIAETTSPAKDVRADIGRPGGLPKNVYIR